MSILIIKPTFTKDSLQKFIGKQYNSEIKKEILKIISPYTIDLCNRKSYYLEYYSVIMVSILVENNIIQAIK